MNALFSCTTPTGIHTGSAAENRRGVARQDTAFLLRLWIGEHISIADRGHHLHAGHAASGEHRRSALRSVSVSADVSGAVVVSGPRFSVHCLDLPELWAGAIPQCASAWSRRASRRVSKRSSVWRAIACRMFPACPLQKMFRSLCPRHLCRSLSRSFPGGSSCIR